MKITSVGLLIFISGLTLVSCSPKKNKEKEEPGLTDSIKKETDTLLKNEQDTSLAKDKMQTAVPTEEATINSLLKTDFADKWHVVTDKEAGWDKNIYDNNIAEKKKRDPDFPFITKGDFNGDGKLDYAAMVTNNGHTENKIAIITGPGHIVIWGEDYIGNGTLETFHQDELKGLDKDGHEKKVKMKGDGIKVIVFDVAGYTIYWDGSAFTYLSMEL